MLPEPLELLDMLPDPLELPEPPELLDMLPEPEPEPPEPLPDMLSVLFDVGEPGEITPGLMKPGSLDFDDGLLGDSTPPLESGPLEDGSLGMDGSVGIDGDEGGLTTPGSDGPLESGPFESGPFEEGSLGIDGSDGIDGDEGGLITPGSDGPLESGPFESGPFEVFDFGAAMGTVGSDGEITTVGITGVGTTGGGV